MAVCALLKPKLPAKTEKPPTAADDEEDEGNNGTGKRLVLGALQRAQARLGDWHLCNTTIHLLAEDFEACAQGRLEPEILIDSVIWMSAMVGGSSTSSTNSSATDGSNEGKDVKASYVDLEQRIWWRSLLYRSPLRQAFLSYKDIKHPELTWHCEQFLKELDTDAALLEQRANLTRAPYATWTVSQLAALLDNSDGLRQVLLALLQVKLERPGEGEALVAVLGSLTNSLLLQGMRGVTMEVCVLPQSFSPTQVAGMLGQGQAMAGVQRQLDAAHAALAKASLEAKTAENAWRQKLGDTEAQVTALKAALQQASNDLAEVDDEAEGLEAQIAQLKAELDQLRKEVCKQDRIGQDDQETVPKDALKKEEPGDDIKVQDIRTSHEKITSIMQQPDEQQTQIERSEEKLVLGNEELKQEEEKVLHAADKASIQPAPTPGKANAPPPPPPLPTKANVPPPSPIPGKANVPPPPPIPGKVNAPAPGSSTQSTNIVPAVVVHTRPKPTRRTKLFQWDPLRLSPAEFAASIWSECDELSWEPKIDLAAIEMLFLAKTSVPSESVPVQQKRDEHDYWTADLSQMFPIIESKRALNLSIILGSIVSSKMASPRDRMVGLRQAILGLDYATVTESLIEQLVSFVPNQDELAKAAQVLSSKSTVSVGCVSLPDAFLIHVVAVLGDTYQSIMGALKFKFGWREWFEGFNRVKDGVFQNIHPFNLMLLCFCCPSRNWSRCKICCNP